jgi:hypothetical protein
MHVVHICPKLLDITARGLCSIKSDFGRREPVATGVAVRARCVLGGGLGVEPCLWRADDGWRQMHPGLRWWKTDGWRGVVGRGGLAGSGVWLRVR